MRMLKRNVSAFKSFAAIALILVFCVAVMHEYGLFSRLKKKKDFPPIHHDDPCNSSIYDAKHKEFDYSKIQIYIDDLFPKPLSEATAGHNTPVFVSAASSDHVQEALQMLENFKRFVRKVIPDAKLIIYNLGLTFEEIKLLKRLCVLEIRDFRFEKYPDHVKILKGYVFKPIAIQTVLKEYPLVVWMDSSIRFTQTNISELFEDANRLGLICTGGDGRVASRTLPGTFKYFNMEPCAYRSLPEIQAGFGIFKRTEFVVNNIIKPWVGCGLTLGCMMPDGLPDDHLPCEYRNVYGECHRYDQSVLSILLYRAYGTRIEQHKRSYYGPYYVRCIERCTWDGDDCC
ncbi:uncharacterized protein LOC127853881 [Dreissena polymorpha]|nr:uncharacterized protein LOC127853881 [Dreissena polymorpha]